jgi:hypothetical protein
VDVHQGKGRADSAEAIKCSFAPRPHQSGLGSTPFTYTTPRRGQSGLGSSRYMWMYTKARPERTWQYPMYVSQHPGEARTDLAVPFKRSLTPRQGQSGLGSTPITYHNTQTSPERTWQYPVHVVLHPGKTSADLAVPYYVSQHPGKARTDSAEAIKCSFTPRQDQSGFCSTPCTYYITQARPERTRQKP